MNRIFMTGLSFIITKFIQGFGGGSEDITKLKLANVYLHAVKITRLLFIGILGSGACLVFLLTGLFLVHYTIFFYAPWDFWIKVTVTLVCAAVYIVTAVGMFAYFFAEERWMKMFNTEAMIKELLGKT